MGTKQMHDKVLSTKVRRDEKRELAQTKSNEIFRQCSKQDKLQSEIFIEISFASFIVYCILLLFCFLAAINNFYLVNAKCSSRHFHYI